MPKGTVVEEGLYRREEGWYPARLESVTEREIKYAAKAHHKAVERGEAKVGDELTMRTWTWTYMITDGPYRGDTVRGETDPRFTSRADNQPRLWYEALLGRKLEIGEGVDTDIVEGKPCQIRLAHQDPRPKRDGTMGYYDAVVEVVQANAAVSAGSSYADDVPPF